MSDMQVSPRMMRRVVAASVIGNALEWFDFAIFGLFAVVISRLFFPAHSDFASLLLALATFGVGFAMRPLGGVVLGLEIGGCLLDPIIHSPPQRQI